MNNYHQNLNFPTTFLPSENIIAFMAPLIHKYCLKFNPEERQFYILPTNEIPKEFSDWFNKTFPGVEIATWEIFYTPAGHTMPIHSDGYQPFVDFVKINYVYNSPDSTMNWHGVPEGTVIESGLNEHHRPYTVVDPKICKLEHSAHIGTPSLVNVGQLHSVDNTKGKTGRWCFSLVPYIPSRKPLSRLQFAESLELFKDYINA